MLWTWTKKKITESFHQGALLWYAQVGLKWREVCGLLGRNGHAEELRFPFPSEVRSGQVLLWACFLCLGELFPYKIPAFDKVYFSCAKSLQLCSTVCDPVDCRPSRLLCPWYSPGKNTGVGCHTLLQGIFPTWESNLCLLRLLHCRRILYHWAIISPTPLIIYQH